jgi:hypothetical protein
MNQSPVADLGEAFEAGSPKNIPSLQLYGSSVAGDGQASISESGYSTDAVHVEGVVRLSRSNDFPDLSRLHPAERLGVLFMHPGNSAVYVSCRNGESLVWKKLKVEDTQTQMRMDDVLGTVNFDDATSIPAQLENVRSLPFEKITPMLRKEIHLRREADTVYVALDGFGPAPSLRRAFRFDDNELGESMEIPISATAKTRDPDEKYLYSFSLLEEKMKSINALEKEPVSVRVEVVDPQTGRSFLKEMGL